MFLRFHARIKDGKDHRYWSVVENRRCGRGKVVQRQLLYLGEINDSQHESWCRTIEVFDDQAERAMPLALFPADRQLPNFATGFGVQIRLKEMELHRPRQWGACWLACEVYEQLRLHFSPTRASDRGAYLCRCMAYCLHVTLRARLRPLAPGLTFAAIQMCTSRRPRFSRRRLLWSSPSATIVPKYPTHESQGEPISQAFPVGESGRTGFIPGMGEWTRFVRPR
jgi:hypothetical protein